MKAILTAKRWEESAMHWTPERKAAIQYARVTLTDPDNPESPISGLWAVYRKGTILDGDSAANALAYGVAEEVTE